MLIIFIIIQHSHWLLKYKYYGSIELMRKLVLTFTPSYNNKQPHYTGGPTFYWGGWGRPPRPPSWLRPWLTRTGAVRFRSTEHTACSTPARRIAWRSRTRSSAPSSRTPGSRTRQSSCARLSFSFSFSLHALRVRLQLFAWLDYYCICTQTEYIYSTSIHTILVRVYAEIFLDFGCRGGKCNQRVGITYNVI